MYARQFTLPPGGRIALSIVVNVEEGSERSLVRGDKGMEAVDELGMFLKDPIRNHANESNYAFGINVGGPRVLALLARHGMVSTWTVCGQALEAAPALASAITAGGHEACSHGYRWQFQHRMDEEAERAFIRKAAQSIEATTGQRPKGWLSRYFCTDNTRRLLAEEGFVYHMDDFSDEAPFWDVSGSRPIVVVPYQLDTNDMKMWPHPGYTARDWLDYVIDSWASICGSSAGRAGRPCSNDSCSTSAPSPTCGSPRACRSPSTSPRPNPLQNRLRPEVRGADAAIGGAS
jgi:hypothetical protein